MLLNPAHGSAAQPPIWDVPTRYCASRCRQRQTIKAASHNATSDINCHARAWAGSEPGETPACLIIPASSSKVRSDGGGNGLQPTSRCHNCLEPGLTCLVTVLPCCHPGCPIVATLVHRCFPGSPVGMYVHSLGRRNHPVRVCGTWEPFESLLFV